MEWLWIVLAILVILLLGWWFLSGRSRSGDTQLGERADDFTGGGASGLGTDAGTATSAGAAAGAAAATGAVPTGFPDVDRPDVDVPDVDVRGMGVPDVEAPDLGVPDGDTGAGTPSGIRGFADVTAPDVDLAAGEAALGRTLSTDDIELVEGIGPAIKALLNDAGISTWQDLADASPDELRSILERGGSQFNVHDPATWPEQARYALRNEWDELSQLQERLRGGQR
jgi:hypothetical protein